MIEKAVALWYGTAMKQTLILLAGLLISPVLLQAQTAAPIAPAEAPQLVDRVVAVVNNEVITQSEFDLVFQPIYAQVKEHSTGSEFQKQIGEIRLKLLNQMIEDKLVYQESKKLGIEVSDSDVAEQLGEIKTQFPDQQTFEKELKVSGLSEENLKKQLREQIAITRLHHQVIRGKVAVPPTEVENYFKEHPDEFIEKERVEVWSLTLQKDIQSVEKGVADEKTKKKAEEILALLHKGEDFVALAKQYSQDSSSMAGGYVGFVEKGHFFEELDSILFSLPQNSISEVIESERGFHIFKVGKKTPRVEKSFEEIREKVEDKLFKIKAHERFVSWMEELKKQAYIAVK